MQISPVGRIECREREKLIRFRVYRRGYQVLVPYSSVGI